MINTSRTLGLLGLVALVVGGPALLPAAPPSASPAPVVAAQSTRQSASPASNLPAPPPRPLPSNDRRDWGKTYYSLESRANTVVAEFDDSVVTARREPSGRVAVDVQERGTGRMLGRSSVAPETRTLSYTRAGAASQPDTVPVRDGKTTLDWASIQSHLLTQEAGGVGRGAQVRGGYLRRGSGGNDNVDDSPKRLTTKFADGIVAVTTRRTSNVDSTAETGMPYVMTVLTRGDEGIGVVQWHPGKQLLTWHFPGITVGKMTADVLQDKKGGWTFTPTMAWANVQAFAFYEMYRNRPSQQIVSNGLAGAGCTDRSKQSLPRQVAARLLQQLSPTVHADEGCDYLHWLDDTIYRPCCDQHDRCYEKYGCGASSWFWPYTWGPWQCAACNGQAEFCFVGMWFCENTPPCACLMEGGWWDPWEGCLEEPIVINAGSASSRFHLSSAEDGVFFDTHGHGVKQKVAWTFPNQQVGFLVLDRNGNGVIDDGTEWFGNNTVLRSGKKAAHGFAALRDLDGGDASDGAVTPDDEAYAQLRVWFDRNHNGVSEPKELESLVDLGITSLSTESQKTDWVDRNGNIYPLGADLSIQRGNHEATHRMYDVLLHRAE